MIIKRKLSIIIIMFKPVTQKKKSHQFDISNLQPYMMTNMLYLKYNNDIEKEVKKKSDRIKELPKKNENKLITLKEEDQLFWYFYIAKYGFEDYKILDHKFSHEKNIKIRNIETIKKDNSLLKQNKLKVSEFETDLLNSKKISIQTLQGLCIYNEVNLYYVYNNIFYFFNYHDTNEPIIIYKNGKNYSCNISPTTEQINEIKNNNYYVVNINKPLQSISNYKVKDLIEISEKLKINTKMESGKSKNKTMLYEEIKLKF